MAYLLTDSQNKNIPTSCETWGELQQAVKRLSKQSPAPLEFIGCTGYDVRGVNGRLMLVARQAAKNGCASVAYYVQHVLDMPQSGGGLNKKVTIYVPRTVDSETTKDTLLYLALYFGGATAISARGAWIDSSHELVVDDISLVYAYTDTLTNKIGEVYVHCQYLRKELGEEEIALEIDGTLLFIKEEK